MSGWQIALRYHEIRAKALCGETVQSALEISTKAVIDRAKQVLGAVSHPMTEVVAPLTDIPVPLEQAELEVEETIENEPFSAYSGSFEARELWVSYRARKKYPLILDIDTSLSMTGEKLALTAVALAVVALQFPDDPIGVIAFENEPRILKRPSEPLELSQLIRRFIDVPAQGYTHLEAGLHEALELLKEIPNSFRARPASTLLLTDGKYTAGKDPVYLAPRFPRLVVVKMGREKAGLSLCQDLARQGNGTLREVSDFEALPMALYGVVKDLLRRS